jgi:hypothetical protein
MMAETWESGMLAARGVQRASSHGFGVRELLEMAEVMGKLPARVELWGIEIASTEAGQGQWMELNFHDQPATSEACNSSIGGATSGPPAIKCTLPYSVSTKISL